MTAARRNAPTTLLVGSELRALLAAVWCVLVGTGYFLSQFDAVTGTTLAREGSLHDRLQWLYLACAGAVAGLLLYRKIVRMALRMPRRPPRHLPSNMPTPPDD